MTFGEVLRQERIAKKMTQKELADLIGYTQPYVSLAERRDDEPPIDLAQAITHALGITVDEVRAEVRNSLVTLERSQVEQDQEDEEEEDGREAPSFGELLRQAREKENMSRSELSEKSYVTAIQIANLEEGRSINPQKSTIERIQSVLGDFWTKESEMSTEEDSMVPNLGQFEDFDPYDDNTYPEVAGVYVLYDKLNRPVYVGQSGNVKRRLEEHSKYKWFIQPYVQSGMFITVTEKERRLEIESLLIKFQRSHVMLNKNGTRS